MQDHLADCMEDFRRKAKLTTNISVKDFKESFCGWCRNGECPHSHKDDLFTQRVSTQWERLCRAQKADPTLPKYSEIVSKVWKDMRQSAMALELSSRQGDWSVPTEDAVERAIKATRTQLPAEPRVPVDLEGGGITEDPAKEEAPAPPILPQPPVQPLPTPPKREPTFRPQPGNTIIPAGGLMIDGSAPPPVSPKKVVTPKDPWAAPPVTGRVVQAGATVKFGAGGKIKDD